MHTMFSSTLDGTLIDVMRQAMSFTHKYNSIMCIGMENGIFPHFGLAAVINVVADGDGVARSRF